LGEPAALVLPAFMSNATIDQQTVDKVHTLGSQNTIERQTVDNVEQLLYMHTLGTL